MKSVKNTNTIFMAQGPEKQIKGEDWKKEVGNVSSSFKKESIRRQFNLERTAFLTNVATGQLRDTLAPENLKKSGFVTADIINKFKKSFIYKIPARNENGEYKGKGLEQILKTYFVRNLMEHAQDSQKEQPLNAAQKKEVRRWAGQEAALELSAIILLAPEFKNVDLLIEGEIIELKDGKLSIYRETKGRKSYRLKEFALRAADKPTSAKKSYGTPVWVSRDSFPAR